MGSSSPDVPTPGKMTKQALNGLAAMFGQPKGSFKSIFDAQPFFAQLQQMQLGDTLANKFEITDKTEQLLAKDDGLLGSIYKEGMQGPGLSPAEQAYFSQNIASQQAARGVFGSPISAVEAGGLLGMYGVQRGMQRQDRALQILSGLSPQQTEYNVPGNFPAMQQGAYQGYGMYQQAYQANLQAQGAGYAGLGQFLGGASHGAFGLLTEYMKQQNQDKP